MSRGTTRRRAFGRRTRTAPKSSRSVISTRPSGPPANPAFRLRPTSVTAPCGGAAAGWNVTPAGIPASPSNSDSRGAWSEAITIRGAGERSAPGTRRDATIPGGTAGRLSSASSSAIGTAAGRPATLPIAEEEAEDNRPAVPPGIVASRRVPGAERSPAPRIVIASDQAPRLSELLGEAGIPAGVTFHPAAAPPHGAVTLVGRSLNAGFAGGPDGLVLITDRELFGAVRVRRPKALRRVVPRDILERLTAGDLVVHVDHGIGRYERMLRRGSDGEERDYLEIGFAGADRIFVPVEQIARISRYAGAERPGLSRPVSYTHLTLPTI